jgi:hypothetical protein
MEPEGSFPCSQEAAIEPDEVSQPKFLMYFSYHIHARYFVYLILLELMVIITFDQGYKFVIFTLVCIPGWTYIIFVGFEVFKR